MKNKCVSLTGINESSLIDEELDTTNLLDDEAIVKTEYSLISAGTELSRAFGLKKGFKYPVRPGYCAVGRIVEKGKDIKFNIGDKVFIDAPHQLYARVSENKNIIFKLPEEIDSISATFMNMMLVAIQGVNYTDTKLLDTVGVFGLGTVGALAACMYNNLGLNVIGLDPVKQRCEFVKQLGIKYTIDSANQKEEVNKLTNDKGLDIAVDASGISQVIVSAIDCAKRYGQVLLLGSPRVSFETDITPVLSNIHMKNLKVLGGLNQTTPKYNVAGRDDSTYKNYLRCLDLIAENKIDLRKFVSKVIDPKQCQSAYYDLMNNKDKVNCIVFDWTKYE